MTKKLKDKFKDEYFYRPNPTEIIKDKDKHFKDINIIKNRIDLSDKIYKLDDIHSIDNFAFVLDGRKIFLENPEARNHNGHMKQKADDIILSDLSSTKHVNQRKKSLFELLEKELKNKSINYLPKDNYITGIRFKGASIEKSRDKSAGDERYRRIMLYNVMEAIRLYTFSVYSPRKRDEIKLSEEKIQGPEIGRIVDVKVPSRSKIFTFDDNNRIPYYYNITLENYPTKHNDYKYGIAINFKASNIGDEVNFTKYLEQRFPNKNASQAQQDPPIEISAETMAGTLALIRKWVGLYRNNFKRKDMPIVLEQTYIPIPNEKLIRTYDILRDNTVMQENGKLRHLKYNEIETALWDATFHYIQNNNEFPFSLNEKPIEHYQNKKKKMYQYKFSNAELKLFPLK